MTGTAGGGGGKQPRAFFGRYPADEDEWECLVRVLINIRLRSLNTLLAGVRKSAGSTVQVGRLQAAETLLRTLMGHLQCSVRGLGSAASGHIGCLDLPPRVSSEAPKGVCLPLAIGQRRRGCVMRRLESTCKAALDAESNLYTVR